MIEELTVRKGRGGERKPRAFVHRGRQHMDQAGTHYGRGIAEEPVGNELPALDGRVDSVLADLWDNPADAAYDHL